MAASGKNPEAARHGALHRTIPSCGLRVAVTAAVAVLNLGAVTPTRGITAAAPHDLGGRWIFLRAVGGDVTIVRRPAAGAADPVAGEAFVIPSGQVEEFYVDPKGEMTLAHVSTGACSLDISYDVEVGV